MPARLDLAAAVVGREPAEAGPRRSICQWVAMRRRVSVRPRSDSGFDLGRRNGDGLDVGDPGGVARVGRRLRLVRVVQGPDLAENYVLARHVGAFPEVLRHPFGGKKGGARLVGIAGRERVIGDKGRTWCRSPAALPGEGGPLARHEAEREDVPALPFRPARRAIWGTSVVWPATAMTPLIFAVS